MLFVGVEKIDTSETYIKMCQEAKELREKWKWQEGDFYAGKVHKCREFPDNDWPVTFGGACSEDKEPNWRVTCGEMWYSEVWPLFRIDQLIELSEMNWQLFYGGLIEHLSKWPTSEQAGLAFIIRFKYCKIWDGERWIDDKVPNSKS